MSLYSFRALNVQIDRSEGCSVIRCSGRAVLERGLEHLEDASLGELAAGRRVVLDLEGVTHIDARGIGVLARLCRIGLLHGRPVVIVGAGARLRTILRLTQLESVIDHVEAIRLHDDLRTGALLACR
jgi:anti-anti-sigma factor